MSGLESVMDKLSTFHYITLVFGTEIAPGRENPVFGPSNTVNLV